MQTITESLCPKEKIKAQNIAAEHGSPTLFFSEQERGNVFLYHLLHGIKSWADNTYESITASEV